MKDERNEPPENRMEKGSLYRMKVLINGETKEIPGEVNLSQLLKQLSLPSERIAIELNKEVVRRKDWENIQLKDADKIEIVHFVGGG